MADESDEVSAVRVADAAGGEESPAGGSGQVPAAEPGGGQAPESAAAGDAGAEPVDAGSTAAGSGAEAEGAADGAPSGPGATLRRARESAGLELADVAEVLNLRESVVQALEEDRFDDLPVRAFARGYVRSYAKLMKADANEMVAGFEQVATERPMSRPLVQDDSPSWRDISARRPALVFGGVVLLIVIAAAAVLVAFWPDVSPWDAWRDSNGDGAPVEAPAAGTRAAARGG